MLWIAHPSLEPDFNLALEEALLDEVADDARHPGFGILWQNCPTVVVGRFQNTHREVNLSWVQQNEVRVVRRLTGGGAVYHDAGTLNYTFIQPVSAGKRAPSFRELAAPVVAALHELGLNVVFSGRNDLMLGERKVAGVAQCRRGGALLHHGCILVHTDLDALTDALCVDVEKFRSRGVASVRSRVCNLADEAPVSVEQIRQGILQHAHGTRLELNAERLAAAQARRPRYASWDWTYGASPPFSERKAQRFAWGGVELLFSVRSGTVEECKIFGDFFSGGEGDALASLEEALKGRAYTRQALGEALDEADLESLFRDCEPQALRELFLP